MAIQLLSGMTSEWFCLDEEKKSDSAEFEIQPLVGMDHAQVMVDSGYIDGFFVMSQRSLPFVLERGVKNWRNVLDENGSPVEFSLDNLRRLPGPDLYQLASKICQMSVLDPDEKKTS